MTATALDKKIQNVFGDFAIDKGLIMRMGLSGDDRHVPSYVLDWIVTHKSSSSDSTQALEKDVHEFIQKHLPAKGDKNRVKYKLAKGETITLLDAISVRVSLGKNVEYSATVPCLDENKVKINDSLISEHGSLLQGSTWGAAKLTHDLNDGGIRIVDFKPMQTGRISVDAFRDCREAFDVAEWIDLLVRTMGYEPTKYSDKEKIWLLCRLIPVVQNRVNMMELAPPGSGKSYVYNNISRHVWLTAAEISPAVLFYNRANKTPGLLTRYDLLVLDEAQSIRFTNASEIQAQLKGYLEQGVYTRGDCTATAECGMMLLANIELSQDTDQCYRNGQAKFKPARPDFIRKLPTLFQESPLLDRFHGLLPGWEIPPFETEQQACGFGLKADYFAEVCHSLRNASDISRKVRTKLKLTGGKRDCVAIERMAAGLAKLLLIDYDHPRYEELVVEPAFYLRQMVRSQLNAVDPEGYDPALKCFRPAESKVLEKLEKYDLLEEIGKGGFAVVYKALDTETEEIVALKRVATEGDLDSNAIQREIAIYMQLRDLSLPNVLAVLNVIKLERTYALVTEYADGGNLFELIGGDGEQEVKPLDKVAVRSISLNIATGLAGLHSNNIVHRDIKPQNILRLDDKWMIADFGISKFIDKPVTGYTFQGAHSKPWSAPEQIQGAEADPSADIYSFGLVMRFLLTGKSGSTTADIPDEWKGIIEACTKIDPDQRPSISVVRGQLESLSL